MALTPFGLGGTCLRACYGSNRLSEDLDFTGGADFKRGQLTDLGGVLTNRLQIKYGLTVEVSEPYRDVGNVDTWKLKVITHPEQRNIPMQRINICLLYTSPSPRDQRGSRMPSSA